MLSDHGADPALASGPQQDFRISVAGAQEKTALPVSTDRAYGSLPTGTTHHRHSILKPSLSDPLPNGNGPDRQHRETSTAAYRSLRWQALGLPVARTEIADFEGTARLWVGLRRSSTGCAPVTVLRR